MASAVTSEHRPNLLVNGLTVGYFGLALLEVTAEYFRNTTFIWASKPLLMPVLALLYFLTSREKSILFLLAVTATWGANIFFISPRFDCIITGTVLFTTYRILCIILVLQRVKLPGAFPLLVGCLPFLFLYLFVVNMTYDELEEGFWLFILQGVFMVVYGGLSLGYYMFNPSKCSTYLLISSLFFTFTQFLFVIRLFYLQSVIFQPLAMILYVGAQYLFYRFMICKEDRSAGKVLI